jgi:hypothetical protein
MNLAPVSRGLTDEASVSVASSRAAKREKCQSSPRLSETKSW